MATLSGSVSELCHISGVSPTRPHQVPVTVLPGCPWEPRDTIAPSVPHHQAIRAIFTKVDKVRQESMTVYSCTKALKMFLFSLYLSFIIWLTLFMWFTIVLLSSSWLKDTSHQGRWYLPRHAKMSESGSVEWTLVGVDAIFNLTRGVGVIWKVRGVH